MEEWQEAPDGNGFVRVRKALPPLNLTYQKRPLEADLDETRKMKAVSLSRAQEDIRTSNTSDASDVSLVDSGSFIDAYSNAIAQLSARVFGDS